MPQPNSAPSPRLHRALVVDDDALMRELLSDKLRDHGIGDVAVAGDGRAALTKLDRSITPPDLLVCDLHMPEADGFQLMEELGRRKFPGAILLVSGMDGRVRSSAALMARFHHLRVIGTLDKPVDDAALARALAELG